MESNSELWQILDSLTWKVALMKHLDPRQLPKKAPAASPRKSSTSRWLVLFALGTLGAGATATWLFPTSPTDKVSQAERDARQNSFSQLQQFSLVPVPADATQQALDQMQLPPTDRAALQSALGLPSNVAISGQAPGATANTAVPNPSVTAAPNSGNLRLARFDFWDTQTQDGDVVAFISAGYRREVPLSHGSVSVTIPVDGSGVVQVMGIRDGGGGITLGLRGANQEVLMPIMSEGQVLSLPVGR